ncbi:hypothetical protein ACQWTT_001283 [Acinetobacter baumannii]
MKYYQFKGGIKLIQPFTVNLPNSIHFPVDTNGNPLMPASTLRGWLRFASYRSLIEVMKRNGELFSIHEHYLLAKGMDTGKLIKNERATTIGRNIDVRKVNPIMDLYGRWGISGALGVGSAIAPISSLVKSGNSSRSHIIDTFDDFENFINQEDQQMVLEIIKQDAIAAPQIQELKNKIKLIQHEKRNAPNFEQKAELNKQIQTLQDKVNDIKEAKTGSKEIVRRINYGLDIIDANTDAQHCMKLTGNHASTLHFLCWTISKLSLFRVGGGRALNYGEVEPFWKITEHTFSHPEGITCGEIGWKDGEFKMVLNDELSFDLQNFETTLTNKDIFNFKYFG